MASTSESGHVKNLTNMDELISNAVSYNGAFDPSREALKVASLQAITVKGRDAVDKVNVFLSSYKKAVAARMTAFAPLNKLVTRVLNFLKSTGSSDHMNEVASGYVRKIQGRRAAAKRNVEETAGAASQKEISASQMSFDNRLDNFDKFIKLLSDVESYSPNEADLKISALKALYEDLKTKNSNVILATVALNNARILRNDILYTKGSGLVDIAQDVKNYVKSVFGPSSPQYRKIAKLEFARIRV